MRSRSSVYRATEPSAHGTARALSMNSIAEREGAGAGSSARAIRSPVVISIATIDPAASA